MSNATRIAMAALGLATLSARAETSLREQGDRLQRAGHYREALQSYQGALAQAETAAGIELVEALTHLGAMYRLLGEYGKAVPYFARALTTLTKDARASAEDLAMAHNNLAAVDMLLGRYADAQHLLEQALRTYERAPGATDAGRADLLNNMGAQCHRRGSYREACSYFQQALNRVAKGSFASALYLTNYGSSLLELADMAKAARVLSEALEIRESGLGPAHPETGKTLYYVGLCALRQREYDQARQYFERVIAIETALAKPNNQDLGVCWANYATVLRKLHRKADAEVAERQATTALKADGWDTRITIDVLSLVPPTAMKHPSKTLENNYAH